MTGTAETEAEEFHKIYGLEVVVIPTHREMIRADYADLVYAKQSGKWNAVLDEITEEHEKGRPVLVGTISVEVSEMLGGMLKRRGIKHNVLNAKFHEKEAEIVAQAGRAGAVTIATNMAGRGTDILLGGNPEVLAAELLHKKGTNILEASKEEYDAALAEAERITAEEKERVLAAGGLHIVGTERHEARRIDNQLRGRTGRQGDPGSSRFYLSLEDDLMKRFASDRVQGIMRTLGFTDDVALESKMVSRTIEGAQTRVEGYNFDMRKHVVEYDDVINRQRETIYRERDRILRSENLGPTIEAMVDDEVATLVADHTAGDHPDEWNLDGLRAQLATMVPSLTDADLAILTEARDQGTLTEQLTDLDPGALRAQAQRDRRPADRHPRAARPPARHRLAVGRAPHRDRRHAPRHRPAGLLAARAAERVQDRGVPDVRRAEVDDPPRRHPHDLPGLAAAAASTPSSDRWPATSPRVAPRSRARSRSRRPVAPGTGRATAAARASRRGPGRSSAATTRAGAARARSTRSATGPDPADR